LLITVLQLRISRFEVSNHKTSNYEKKHFLSVFTCHHPNTYAQSNSSAITAKITNRISDTLSIRGANGFNQVIPINNKQNFDAYRSAERFYQLTDGKLGYNLYLNPTK
jgi:hypothetical protein